MVLHPSKPLIATTGQDALVRLWSVDGKRVAEAKLPRAGNAVAFSDGDRLHSVAITPGDQLRITLAINRRRHKPSAPLCIETPYDAAELAPFTAGEELCVASSEATKASPLRLPADELAVLPHRKFCPIDDATT